MSNNRSIEERPFGGSPHLGDDQALDFAAGLVSADTARAWLEHARSCQPCENLLRAAAATHERGQSESRSLPAFDATAGWTRRFGRRISLLGLLAAAVLTLVLRAPWFAPPRPKPSEAGKGAELLLPDAPERDAFRSQGGSMADSALREGVAAYSRRDFARARQFLTGPPREGSAEYLRCIYLASAQFMLGEPKAAIESVTDVKWGFVPEPWGSQARFVLAEAYRRIGQSAKADSVLRQLAEEQPGAVGERARELLRR